MSGTIRNQILIPFASLQAVAIMVISAMAAWTAAERAEQETMARLNQVVATLSNASFPVQGTVLEQMKGLSGAEFIALRGEQEIVGTTLTNEQTAEIIRQPGNSQSASQELTEFQTVLAGLDSFLLGRVAVMRSPNLSELIVLVPERQWQTIRREVVLPPLAIGCLTLVATVGLSWLLAAGFGGRLKRMEQQVGRLASLRFDELLPVSGNDELTRLATSINSMAMALQNATDQIRSAERSSLVAQVAGGLAHQLRNSITGARMAVQLHLRRCNHADQESLQVALRQLSLTESQIRGLLSLTRDSQRAAVSGQLIEILADIRELLGPQFQHSNSVLTLEGVSDPQDSGAGVSPWSADVPKVGAGWEVADRDQIHAALLNLIQNALEACRPNGQVRVSVERKMKQIVIEILDNGPGVTEDLKESMFMPFVTGKPEGVGLGLTLATQVAGAVGGRLVHERRDGWTVFRFEMVAVDAPETAMSL